MTSTNHDIDISRYHHSVSVALVYLRGRCCCCCFCCRPTGPPVQPEEGLLQYSGRPPQVVSRFIVEINHVRVLRSGENLKNRMMWRRTRRTLHQCSQRACRTLLSLRPCTRTLEWSEVQCQCLRLQRQIIHL